MPRLNDRSKMVGVRFDRSDLDALRNGETLTMDCPHTDAKIFFSRDSPTPTACECCGAEVEKAVTPSMRGIVNRLENGDTVIYDRVYESVGTDDEPTMVLSAEYDVCGGWSSTRR
jgi:hypothetical protein